MRLLLCCLLALALALPAESAFAQDPEADLSALNQGPGQTTADTDIAFTFTVTNGGPETADTPTLNDDVPAGTTFVSLTQDSGPTFLCTSPAVGGGGTVSCSRADLAVGASATFTLTVHVAAGAPGGTFITDIAKVSMPAIPPGTTFDPNSENDEATATTLVGPVSTTDVGVSVSAPEAAVPGSDITYSISVSNAGPDAADLSFSDPLPGATTFTSLSSPGGFTCTTPAVGSGGTVSCSATGMASGTTATLTLVVNVPAATPSGTYVTNSATVSTGSYDPNSENDAATTSTLIASADLSVVVTGPANATAGDPVAYTITVSNAGPDGVPATLTDELPPNTTFVSLTQNSGPTFSLSTPAVGGTGTVSASNGFFASGATAQFTLTVAIDPPTQTPITNTATIGSSIADPDPADNSSSVQITVTPLSANLSVVASGPSDATAGKTISYTITVANAGPDLASQVTLSDPLPANTTLVSFTQDSGPAFSLTSPPVGGTGTAGGSIATLASGASAQFTLQLAINPATPDQSTLTNTATIASPVADPSTANNSSSVQTAVVQPKAALSIAAFGPATALAGDTISYTINIANAGPEPAAPATLSDQLPANTTFVSFTQDSGPALSLTTPAVGGTGTASATIATLASGASAQFKLRVKIDAATPDPTTITNTATIASPVADPNTANNSSTSQVAVKQPPKATPTPTPTPVATATPIPTPTATPTPGGPCLSLRRFTVHVGVGRNQRIRSATATLGGKRLPVRRSGRRAEVDVNLRGKPAATYTLRIRLRSSSGRTRTVTRRYRTCAQV